MPLDHQRSRSDDLSVDTGASPWADHGAAFGYVDVSVRRGRRQGMLAHLDHRPAIVSANVLTIAEAEALPRPLRVDQLRRLFASL